MSPQDWLLPVLEQSSSRLNATLDRLKAEDLIGASGLPGWTRAHVLTHVARNADGLRNLLLAARSRQVLRMYACPTARSADVEAGVGRDFEVIVADVVESSRRFGIDASMMTDEDWSVEVQFTSGQPDPPLIAADLIPSMRLNEVELHHVDMVSGYTFRDTPPELARHLLGHYAARRARQGVALTVSADDLDFSVGENGVEARGTAAALLGWLTGRTSGAGLRCDGGLPLRPSLG